MNAEVRELPLFPLNAVLFPGGPLPLRIFEPRYLDMVSRCMREQSGFAVVLLGEGEEVGDGDEFCRDRDRGADRGFRPARGRCARHQLHRPRARAHRRGLARGRRPQSRARARHRGRPGRAVAARSGLAERSRDAGHARSRRQRIVTSSGARTRPGSRIASRNCCRCRSPTARHCSNSRIRSNGCRCSSPP